MAAYQITDKCIGCMLCAKNCPVKAISGESKERHYIDPEKCISCGVCGKLCPKEAVLDPEGNTAVKTAKEDWENPVFDYDLCTGCSICIENCPKDCLDLVDPLPDPAENNSFRTVASLMRPEECIDCKICYKVCPAGAVSFKSLSEEIEKSRDQNDLNRAGRKVTELIGAGRRGIDPTAAGRKGIDLIRSKGRGIDLNGAGRKGSDLIRSGRERIDSIVEDTKGRDLMGTIKGERNPLAAGKTFLQDQIKKGDITVPGNVYKAGCRAFHGGMKVGSYFLGYRAPAELSEKKKRNIFEGSKYISGSGCMARVPELLRSEGIEKVLFVTDEGLVKLGLAARLTDILDAAGIEYVTYYGVKPNPTSDNVEEAFRIFRDHGCQGTIAMGGGSPIDCAKAAGALAAHPKKTIKQLQGLLTVHKKTPLLIAIPTTAGTGSETTIAAVITDSKTHHKKSINDPSILPKYAILDPDLTVGLPPFITATTGMDALCHAVESYTNHTYNTRLEDKLALKAVELIHEYLPRAYEDGNDIIARENMQKAAFFAGRSFTRGCVGYVHSIGHQLGGLYGVPHGLAMSIILPHVMRKFGPAVYESLADLADVCDIKGYTDQEKAIAFIEWIEKIKEDMGIPEKLDMIKDEDVEQIITWAMKEGNPLYPVPVVWGRKDFRQLIDLMRE